MNEEMRGRRRRPSRSSRTGGSDGAVIGRLRNRQRHATATAGSDYTANSGTLNFADGDIAAKTITVSIIDDTVDEAERNLHGDAEQRRPAARGWALRFRLSRLLDNDEPVASRVLHRFHPHRFRSTKEMRVRDGDLHGEPNGRQRRSRFGQLLDRQWHATARPDPITPPTAAR